ncbi:hypothetical protein BVRB_8g181740 [Beta vulgaris subsp. vulgaris]|nr:hypothetical protein BVRB_8g181740 [Beta vulgaris subsp. vulgaris]
MADESNLTSERRRNSTALRMTGLLSARPSFFAISVMSIDEIEILKRVDFRSQRREKREERMRIEVEEGKLADTYGPIFMIKLGKDRALVVSSAEMAKQCLGAGDKVFLNRPHKIFVEHMAYNTALLGFSPYGEYWRELRKIITIELLSNHRVEMFKNVRVSEVRSGINRISGTGSELVDMKQWFHDISINTIIRLVSGKSSIEFHQSEVHNQCMKAIRDFFELAGVFVPADALPFLRWLDIGGYEKKMKRVAKVIDVVAQKWLEEHKERKSSKEKDEKRDFMDVMLSVFETGQDKPFKFDSDTIIKATSMVSTSICYLF